MMAKIVVAGGGICGSAAALMLARDGHEVTVLDRDPGPVPADVEAAWADWNRRGVGQFRFAHVLLARGYHTLRAALPDVVDTLRANGGLVWNQVADALPSIPGAKLREDDGRFETVTGRRTSIEWSLAEVLAAEPGVEVRRGVAIAGLVPGPAVLDGVVHVAGVRLEDGEEIAADLVIDATGRRSPTGDWLVAIGGQAPVEESEDVGFSYAGRFFRSTDGSVPEHRAPGLTPCGSISLLTIPSDNGTWAATIYTASDDKPMRRVRDWDVFQRVWRSFPDHAHWLDGEPIGELESMSGAVDRSRRFVVDGRPIVTGMLTIADAHACTNPSIGRGMTIGLMHTTIMRDAVRAHLDDPVRLALAFHAASEEQVGPWHEATRAIDRGRMVEMRAAIDGRVLEPAPEAAMAAALAQATRTDEDALRWMAEIVLCLALPLDVFSRPDVFVRVLELGAAAGPPEPYGPDRTRLLEMCS
jgi:2-polyprenyl-6-methoxyphenol hydroxylase-like FAD-dependent oxidoreductase